IDVAVLQRWCNRFPRPSPAKSSFFTNAKARAAVRDSQAGSRDWKLWRGLCRDSVTSPGNPGRKDIVTNQCSLNSRHSLRNIEFEESQQVSDLGWSEILGAPRGNPERDKIRAHVKAGSGHLCPECFKKLFPSLRIQR